MSARVPRPKFDPDAWAKVQIHFRRLVSDFDARGLLDPDRPDDQAYVAMGQAAKEDKSLYTSLRAIAGAPWPYFYITGPPSEAERARARRRAVYVDEQLSAHPDPAEEVHAVMRAMELFPEPSQREPFDFRKVARVQHFIEKEAVLGQNEDAAMGILEELEQYLLTPSDF